jgi:hypothetical protein
MSQVLERERTEYRAPVRGRSPVLDYTLMTIGALAVAVGLYFQFAPSEWWLAHFSGLYHPASYTVGGLFLTAGFGAYARRVSDEDDSGSTRAVVGTILALIACAGAVIAALALVR